MITKEEIAGWIGWQCPYDFANFDEREAFIQRTADYIAEQIKERQE
jgi:hypothetical protein